MWTQGFRFTADERSHLAAELTRLGDVRYRIVYTNGETQHVWMRDDDGAGAIVVELATFQHEGAPVEHITRSRVQELGENDRFRN